MTVYPSLTDRLKTQHQAIEPILMNVSDSRLSVRPQAGKWNMHDNITHLVKYQPVFIDRIDTILLEDEPLFGRYKAENDPEFETYRMWDTNTLIKQLMADREKIYALVTGLTDAQLKRIGMHKKFGALNIIQWTEFFLLHEAHHIFTIFQLAHDTEL